MIELLELPDSAYEKAIKRYKDIGKWLSRDDSSCKYNDPHIFAQGSFRFGTAIRPLDEKEEYDLDLVCNLREGITKSRNTQNELKELIGYEIELYRRANGIKSPMEEKHRCWRLEYQDSLSFHMDIVPCIPEDNCNRKIIYDYMKIAGESELISESVSQLAVSITDDRHYGYRIICDDWEVSNPEGYAEWFKERMKQNAILKRLMEAQVDDIPLFKRKTPLQRVVQLLKRHRDQMYKDNDDCKPISIIITTLAAKAYQGETDIESALSTILSHMGSYINSNRPRVPNPTCKGEDFADRWYMPEYSYLRLEDNFWHWLQQAQEDFRFLESTINMKLLSEHAMQKFSVRMKDSDLMIKLGIASGTKLSTSENSLLASPVRGSGLSFPDKPIIPKKPGGFA